MASEAEEAAALADLDQALGDMRGMQEVMKVLFATVERAWNAAKTAGLQEWELVQFSRDRALAMGGRRKRMAGECHCWVRHALTDQELETTWAQLEYFRSIGDMHGFWISLVQYAGPCPGREQPGQEGRQALHGDGSRDDRASGA
jgi:hypothetical protein